MEFHLLKGAPTAEKQSLTVQSEVQHSCIQCEHREFCPGQAPDAEASGSLKETQETEVAPKSSLEDAKAPTEVSVVAASEAEAKPEQPPDEALALAEATKATGPSECSAPDASPAQASAEASADDTTEGAKVPEAEKSPSVQPGHESKDGTLLAEHEHEHEETDGEEHEFGETAHLVELEAEEDPEFEQEEPDSAESSGGHLLPNDLLLLVHRFPFLEDVDEEDAEEEEEEVYKEEAFGKSVSMHRNHHVSVQHWTWRRLARRSTSTSP